MYPVVRILGVTTVFEKAHPTIFQYFLQLSDEGALVRED